MVKPPPSAGPGLPSPHKGAQYIPPASAVWPKIWWGETCLYATPFILNLLGAIIYIMYLRKAKELGTITGLAKMNKTLFRALTAQIILMLVNFFIPLIVLDIAIYVRLNYANFIGQLTFFVFILYPINEILALMYFVKPYREFVLQKFIYVFVNKDRFNQPKPVVAYCKVTKFKYKTSIFINK